MIQLLTNKLYQILLQNGRGQKCTKTALGPKGTQILKQVTVYKPVNIKQ
jgi:hypothetical protein